MQKTNRRLHLPPTRLHKQVTFDYFPYLAWSQNSTYLLVLRHDVYLFAIKIYTNWIRVSRPASSSVFNSAFLRMQGITHLKLLRLRNKVILNWQLRTQFITVFKSVFGWWIHPMNDYIKESLNGNKIKLNFVKCALEVKANFMPNSRCCAVTRLIDSGTAWNKSGHHRIKQR